MSVDLHPFLLCNGSTVVSLFYLEMVNSFLPFFQSGLVMDVMGFHCRSSEKDGKEDRNKSDKSKDKKKDRRERSSSRSRDRRRKERSRSPERRKRRSR